MDHSIISLTTVKTAVCWLCVLQGRCVLAWWAWKCPGIVCLETPSTRRPGWSPTERVSLRLTWLAASTRLILPQRPWPFSLFLALYSYSASCGCQCDQVSVEVEIDNSREFLMTFVSSFFAFFNVFFLSRFIIKSFMSKFKWCNGNDFEKLF